MTGRELLHRRVALGLTQEALADTLEIAPSTLSRWEAGKTVITRGRMLDLALAMLEQQDDEGREEDSR